MFNSVSKNYILPDAVDNLSSGSNIVLPYNVKGYIYGQSQPMKNDSFNPSSQNAGKRWETFGKVFLGVFAAGALLLCSKKKPSKMFKKLGKNVKKIFKK